MSSSSTFTSSTYSYSSSGTSNGQQVTGERHAHQAYTDPSGTTVKTASQNLGEPMMQETRQYDSEGRQLLEAAGSESANRRIEDVTGADEGEAEKATREYEERMEDEYAKKDGGA